MALPEVTHLQFIVLTMLLEGERSGRQLRSALAENGIKKTGPAFYQLMARLEDDGLVEGWYDQKVIEEQAVKERHYRITTDGEDAWEDTCNFYRSHSLRRETINAGR